MFKTIVGAAAVSIALAGAASAAVVFSDNFDYGTTSVLNIPVSAAPGNFADNWTTTPTVDYIHQSSSHGTLCRGTGGCIDLDGTSNSAGLLSTVQSFAAGTYELSFGLFGSLRNTTEAVTISLGDFSWTISGIGSDDDVSDTVRFTTTGGVLSFQNAGGDNIGAVLTNVELAAVPVPAAGLMLIGALGGLAMLRRRNDQTAA